MGPDHTSASRGGVSTTGGAGESKVGKEVVGTGEIKVGESGESLTGGDCEKGKHANRRTI